VVAVTNTNNPSSTTEADTPKPTVDEIRDWLATTYPAVKDPAGWARFLDGLPWGYIKPVCQIAVNAHHDHPAVVLSTAAAASQDLVFKLAARNHLAGQS
jgi:hypothetical protein